MVEKVTAPKTGPSGGMKPMAYVKTGRVREVRTRTKVVLAVILAVVLLALAAALFAAKDPRAAAKLVMSDRDYASYVILKNVRDKTEAYRPFIDRLTENTAYESTGQGMVELSKDMQDLIGSEEVLETAQKYTGNLVFTGTTQKRGLQFSNELKLNDRRQTIFTHDLAYLPSGLYSSVPEYGYGWTRILGTDKNKNAEELRRERVLYAVLTSDNTTVREALTKSAKAGYKAVKKDLQVTIDKNEPVDFQDKRASGDRVNILVSRENAETFLNAFFEKFEKKSGLRDAINESLDTDDAFGSDESLHTFLDRLHQSLEADLTNAGVSNLSVDLSVDKKNRVNAFDALVKRAKGDVIVNAMLKDDRGRGPAFHLRAGGETIAKFNVEKASQTTGTVDFTLRSFENTLTYSGLELGNGLVYGIFEFEPVKLASAKDFGLFGLHLTVTPSETAGASGFHVLAQTGFSTLGTATIDAEVKDAEYTGMLTEEDIVLHPEYKKKEKQARRLQYWLADLPEQDAQYKNALRHIVETILNETLEAAKAAAATEDSTLSEGATKPVS